LALDDDGRVFSWGSGLNGKLGHGGEMNMPVPSLIESLAGVKIVRLAAGCEHSAVIDSMGRLFTFGHGDGGRLGHGDASQSLSPKLVTILETMKLQTTQVRVT
jgi:E3 ubiquitin-protein ligase HERC2